MLWNRWLTVKAGQVWPLNDLIIILKKELVSCFRYDLSVKFKSELLHV